jgi:hypothetical protein
LNPEFDYSRRNSNLLFKQVRHRIFVSYHHGNDQPYYDLFSKAHHDTYETISDRSLERKVDSDDPAYVMQRIRDTCIDGTSCTVVLLGRETGKRKYVDWEIKATLDRNHALLGIVLPTATVINGNVIVPDRFNDNLQSGYADWCRWEDIINNPPALQTCISAVKLRSTVLMDNTRTRLSRNLS